VRVKIEKAEEQVPKPSPGRSLEQLLTQDDALRLAKETASRSREVEKQDLQELYEKVVLDEISIPEYFYFISNSVKGPAYSSVLKEIRNNLGRFV
jgi:hypothetical protein